MSVNFQGAKAELNSKQLLPRKKSAIIRNKKHSYLQKSKGAFIFSPEQVKSLKGVNMSARKNETETSHFG